MQRDRPETVGERVAAWLFVALALWVPVGSLIVLGVLRVSGAGALAMGLALVLTPFCLAWALALVSAFNDRRRRP